MELSYVKYGSLITLSTSEGFYLYSQGFVDSSPYLREQTKDFFEFSGAVVRIIPQSMHSVQSTILEYIKNIREIDYYEKINSLIRSEESLEGEIKSNIHSYESLKGEIVRYNSLVQLEHLTSHKFLTMHSKVSAEGEKDNYKVSFEDFPSAYSHFRIVPSFKFQTHGSGKVKVFDKVYLEIMVPELRKVAWMHASKGQSVEMLSNGTSLSDSQESVCKAIEVNVSLDQKTRWSIGIYGDSQQDLKFLACGDYIWLTMPEGNVCITVYKKSWEVEKYKFFFSDKVSDGNGLWMIENENAFKGGVVISSNKYRLKHITTGKYLAITEGLVLKKRPTDCTLWYFRPYFSGDEVKSGELCYIIHCKTSRIVQYIGTPEISLSSKLTERCIYKPTKANNEVVWEILFLLHSYPILINFPKRIIHERSTEREDISQLEEFKKYCNLVLKCIKNLKLFCKNRLHSMIGIDNHFGEVQHSRQLMLKQQNFFEALAKILDCAIEEDECLQISKLSQSREREFRISKADSELSVLSLKKLAEIISKIYSLLITMCDKNNETQLHGYSFIKTFTKHIGLNFGATKLILSILRNNEELMLGIHHHKEIDIIKYYSTMLVKFQSERKTEFLEFLKSVCVYKGEGISVNQEKIFASIFKDKNLIKKALIFTETEGNTLFIHLDSRRSDLTQCFEGGRIIGYDSEMKYFTGLLDLYAHLCIGRNFESSALFIPKFPFEVLNTMIWHDNLTINLRATFCRFMLHMYIDCFMREEVESPELIKIIMLGELEGPLRQQTLYTARNDSKRSTKQKLAFVQYLEDSQSEAFVRSRDGLKSLIRKLFDYFQSDCRSSDYALTYELLQVLFKLIKFQELKLEEKPGRSENGSFDEDNIEPDLAQMLKLIVPLLLKTNEGRRKSISQNSKKRSTRKETKETKINHAQHLASILKDSNSLNDPVIRSAANLKNILTTYKQNPFNGLEKKLNEHKIKLKICKILNYYLDMRQDFLINNTIEWFNQITDHKAWQISDLSGLMPQIIHVSNNHVIFSKIALSDFNWYKEPFVPDINSLSKDPQKNPIIPLLLSIFIASDNYKLQTSLLSLIFRSFSQRREMLKNIKRLHVVFKNDDIVLLNWVKSSLLSFKHHSEQSELWMTYWNSGQKNQEKHKEIFSKMRIILRDIEYFLFDDTLMTDTGPSEPKTKIISRSRQELLYYLNAHKLIVNLLKDGMFKLASIYSSNRQEELREPCELLTELFKSCNRVLKRFVFNNSRNQKKIHKSLHILFQYLHLPLGQIPLICEIYKNNWKLIDTVSESMIKTFENLILKYGRQKEFLRFLEVIQSTNGRPNTVMQRLVLSLFINEKVNNYMMYMDDNEVPEFIYCAAVSNNPFYRDEPFDYHAALLNVLSKCGLGVTGMMLNELKCQHIISLKNIFKILLQAEQAESPFAEMKLPVLDFFYNIYIDCEITNFDLKACSDFFDYIYLQCRVLEDLSEVNGDYIEFISLWISILSKYRCAYIKKIYESYVEQDDLRAIRAFAEVLSRNSSKFNWKIPRDLAREIYELCHLFGEDFTIDADINESMFRTDAQSTFYRKSTKLEYIHTTVKQIEMWNQVKNAFIYDSHFKEKIHEEVYAMIVTLHYSNKLHLGIDFEKIVRSLISFIRCSRSQKPPISILILVIELFEEILARPITDKFTTEEQAKENLQNEMSFYGLTNVILTLMIDSQLESQVFKALISLSIHLLDGGNFVVQQEFYQYFLTTSNSEYFFQRIFNIFQRKTEKITELGYLNSEEQPVYKNSSNSMTKLLRFLQLLCENHNRSLQNYIRYQEKSQMTYNLIACVISLLDILIKKRNPASFHVISHCFETLTEFIQGPCLDNQVEIINSNFIEIARDLLSIDESSSSVYRSLVQESVVTEEAIPTQISDFAEDTQTMPGWMIAHLKFKCLITVLSLFEGRKDNLVRTRTIRAINIEILKENLKFVYSQYLTYYRDNEYDEEMFNHFQDNEDYDDNTDRYKRVDGKRMLIIENGFLVYHLLKTLQDTDDIEILETLATEMAWLQSEEVHHDQILTHENKEILLHRDMHGQKKYNETLSRVAYKFFQIHTGNIEVVFSGEIFKMYFYYPPEYKGLSKEIKDKFHRHAIRDSDQNKLKYMLDKSEAIIEQIRHEYRIKRFMRKSRFRILFGIATQVDLWRVVAFLLTILMNLIILTSYSNKRGYESLFTFNPDDHGIGRNHTELILTCLGISQLVCCIMIVAFFLIKIGPLLAKKGWEYKAPGAAFFESNPNCFNRFIVKFIQICVTVVYVVRNVDVIYYLLYAVFSILGIFLHPFYFSLLLLDIVYRYPALRTVVNSIVLPRQALFLTFVLMIVIIYIYAIMGYWLLEDDLSPNCKSLSQCFLTVWDKSFKSDGGIGGFMEPQVTPNYSSIRFFYDNTYYILVIVVLMGVVQGIIIDTFARLREGQEFCNRDMENKCFICGLSRDYIEKKYNKGFTHHIKQDHNEWNYILFLAYLESKEVTEYTGFESYVRDQVTDGELAWIPNNSALCLNINTEDKISYKIQGVDSRLELIESQLKELNKKNSI